MQSQSKLLHILGGGEWQLPTVRLAKKLGHRVLVTDMYAERPAYALADFHEVVNITDYEGTLAAAKKYQIDGILCDTTDVGVPTAAYVAERLGLPGIGCEVALNFTSKLRMRELTSRAGLPTPRFASAKTLEQARAAAEDIGFPLVIKPVDAQSSRGVKRLDSVAQLADAFQTAQQYSGSRCALLEEFLPGTEVTVEGLCWHGKHYTLGISDKDHFSYLPTVSSRITYPPAFDAELINKIRQTNIAVTATLGLRHGITHAEYMVHEGNVTLVEIAARGGGSRIYSSIAPYVSGIDVPRLWIEFCLGENPTLDLPPSLELPLKERSANLGFFTFDPGTVTAIHGLEAAKALPGVAEILLEFQVGDVLRPPNDDRSRPGLMVVFGETRDDVLKTSQRVSDLVRVSVA